MAITAAVPVNPCEQALERWCAQWLSQADPVASGPIAVAYSAGADSTALLMAARHRWSGRVLALHVNHGLQDAATDFEHVAADTCGRLGIPMRIAHIHVAPEPGQSPEDAARSGRYRALADMARQSGARCVLLGQHADDQAETIMLALSRGAGLPGLAAMAERFERHGVMFGRPLLGLPSRDLRAWVLGAGHAFVDDPTNADLRFTRNRIRALLLPAWEACFPGFRAMLARSARHVAQAQSLLDELAVIDLAHTGSPPAIAELQKFGRERQTNVLRYWLRASFAAAPSAAQLDELLNQVADCRTRGHRIRLKVAGGFVTRREEYLHYEPSV